MERGEKYFEYSTPPLLIRRGGWGVRRIIKFNNKIKLLTS